MSKLIKIKRGLDLQRQIYIMPEGELVWTTDLHELWIGDGLISGGLKITANIENNYIPNTAKGSVNGVASLDSQGLIPTSQLPALAITEVFVVASEAEQLALVAQSGDVAVRTDTSENWIHNGGNTNSIFDWTRLAIDQSSVISVNGQVGTVVLEFSDLDDTLITNAQPLDLLQWDGSNWINIDPSSVGRTTFTALDDTPADYTNAANNILSVNAAGTAVEFTDTIDGGTYDGNQNLD